MIRKPGLGNNGWETRAGKHFLETTLMTTIDWSKSYCKHFLYCPAQLSWLDFTALFRTLCRVPLSLPGLHEPSRVTIYNLDTHFTENQSFSNLKINIFFINLTRVPKPKGLSFHLRIYIYIYIYIYIQGKWYELKLNCT